MNLGEAQQFLREYEREAAEMCFRVKQSQWNFSTNITDANKRRMLEEQALESKLDRLSWRRATSFTWTRLPDSQTRRQLNMLVTQTRAGLPDNEFDELQQVISEMKDIYSRARVCPYHNRMNNYCDLALEPDLTRALAHTRDYEEQLHLWKAWRDSVGPPIRSRYIHYMQLANKAARINGKYRINHLIL
uniref:(California timema) hypothetical protein n=1 Tax=Timema californicum TaxID=61474 RepID=A0A7R9P2F0_TIMCA|nr:unnamed protein product [Timema californicum]